MSTDPPPSAPVATTQDGDANASTNAANPSSASARSASFSSQKSSDSQTAAEFLRDQMQLEADAREALPYSIESCTKILGPLRQSVFACLTCNPAPKAPSDSFTPAGVCYACSVQCHGEHTLVEIFTKRNFTCDCGTTRMPSIAPCALRTHPETNTKGGVHSEEPDANNKYNQNFRNRFCGCSCDYDPFQQKGTMFQCLGLGTAETGGCGEDWYHPGCLVGMGPSWFEAMKKSSEKKDTEAKAVAKDGADGGTLPTISEDTEAQPAPQEQSSADHAVEDEEDEDPPMPPGFPGEDDFDSFLCYKCVAAHPWIKKYAGHEGFLPPVFTQQQETTSKDPVASEISSTKRKAEDELEESSETKRVKNEPEASAIAETEAETTATTTPEAKKEENHAVKEQEVEAEEESTCRWEKLPEAPEPPFSLFLAESFRNHLCRCSSCYVSKLNPHPQLLEEEETYEPPLSEGAGSEHGGSTQGSGSIYERGESALRNVDRVRAIEGVMAFKHLKEQLQPFFQRFADSGQAIGAEDIKAYFAKLRGDEQGIGEAGASAGASDPKDGDDTRREQSGY